MRIDPIDLEGLLKGRVGVRSQHLAQSLGNDDELLLTL